MKNIYKNTPKFREKLVKLPKIYLVGLWAHYGVMQFPFSGKFQKDKDTGFMIPLVWHYYDGNGTCDNYELIPITNTTTGFIYCWTEYEEKAKRIARALNVDDALRCNLLTLNNSIDGSKYKGTVSIIEEYIVNDSEERERTSKKWEEFLKKYSSECNDSVSNQM